MLSVKVDNQEFSADFSKMRSMNDLIELIKATIDPDKIIVGIELNNEPLSEADWNTPLNTMLNAVQNAELSVMSGNVQDYMKDRFTVAEPYLQHIMAKFSDASQQYRGGQFENANKQLSTAVQDLLAFLNWYMAVMQMKPESYRTEIGEFNNYVKNLQGVCEGMVQQQMFQAWWALGDTLQSKLTPSLDSLKTFCGRNANASM